MKDLPRLRASYEKKSAGKIKALYKKHHRNYMVLHQVQQDLHRFGLFAPQAVVDRFMFHWRVVNIILNLPNYKTPPPPPLPVQVAQPPQLSLLQRFLRWLH